MRKSWEQMRVEEKLDALRNDIALLMEAADGHDKLLGVGSPKYSTSRPTLATLHDMIEEATETLAGLRRDLAEVRKKVGLPPSRY